MRRGLRTAIAGVFAQLVFASPAVAQRVAMDTMSLHRLPGVFVGSGRGGPTALILFPNALVNHFATDDLADRALLTERPLAAQSP